MASTPKKPTGEKQKPERKVVQKAAKDLPKAKTSAVGKSMSGRIMADQKNDPLPNKKDPSPAKAPAKKTAAKPKVKR